MKTLITPLLLVFALCQSALAQVEVNVTKVKAATGATQAQLFNNVLLVDENAELKVVNAAVLKIVTDAKYVQVKARISLFELGEVIKSTDKEWLLLGTTPGKYAVDVTTFDPEKGIDGKSLVVDLTGIPQPPVPPGPGPGPGPNPPGPNPNPDCNNVPEDAFKNLGRRSCGWATGLPMRKEMAGVYATAATSLRTDPSVTINSVAADIVTKRQALLGNNLVQYKTYVDNANNEIKTNWPMNKATLADFFQALSLGLANGQ